MVTVYTGTDNGIVVQDTNAGAVTGRWASDPEVPDRCYLCFDPATLASYPAEGWIPGSVPGLRLGTCHRCMPVEDGALCWYWNQDQDPAREEWTAAIVDGIGYKDGMRVFDVRIRDGGYKWGWPWQLLPRGEGEAAPTAAPAELTRGRP
jgi:hypothetical protein